MRTLSVCSLVLFAALAVTAAATAKSGSAEARDESLLGLKPAPAEAMAPAKVGSEVPFQQYVQLECSDAPVQCIGNLPAVAANERLVIQFVSCNAVTPPDAQPLHSFVMVVTNAQATKVLAAHFIAPTYARDQFFIASQPMLLTVNASRVLRLVANAPSLSFAECAVSGVRQNLG